MPRRKYGKMSTTDLVEARNVESVSSNLGDTYVTSTALDLNEAETEMEDKFREFFEELEAKRKFLLGSLNFSFRRLMLSIPESVLNTAVDMNDETLRILFQNISLQSNDSVSCVRTPVVHTAIKRRRSRSATRVNLHEYGVTNVERRTSKRLRSSSLDLHKTPANKVWLEVLTSTKKYTVSKPKKVEDSGISLKRIMKPDEEAISVSGSPLLVQPAVASAPMVNIPLPGGVVMNILPKRPQGHFPVPDLDEATREQLKILCQQLNNMF